MKKFQKLYQLKQLVKANAEWSRYARLTAKKKHNPEYDEKLIQAKNNFNTLKEQNLSSLTPSTGLFSDDRLVHIVYSLLKGKSYQQIENSVRQENQLQDYEWKKIIDIMKLYKDEENICIIPTSPFPTTKVNLPKVKKVEVSNE